MRRVILFDGVCNLCNSAVNFVIQRDTQAQFKFAPLQSDAARALLGQNSPAVDEFDTVLLLKGSEWYTFSDAALEIASDLDGYWRCCRHFKVVPKSIRDAIYRFIGRHRYAFFGRTETCRVPDSSIEHRFL